MSEYADEATTLDAALDEKLASIRRQSDSGEVTIAEAADLRCAALEEHVAAIAALRIRHFGDEQ